MKEVSYSCDWCGKKELEEENRNNIKGELRFEFPGLGESQLEVNIDLCPDCRNELLNDGYLVIPLSDDISVSFQSSE